MTALKIVPKEDRKPRVIAVFGPKGGIGKTTTAQHLLVAAAEKGYRVLGVDTDDQRTLVNNWYGRRKKHPAFNDLAKVHVVESDIDNYEEVISHHQDYDMIVFDMAPGLKHREVATAEFLKRATFVVMPCSMGNYDYEVVEPWMAQLTAWRVPAVVVFNKIKKKTSNIVEARSYLARHESFSVDIPDTVEIMNASKIGLTCCDLSDAKLHNDYMSLFSYVDRKAVRKGGE